MAKLLIALSLLAPTDALERRSAVSSTAYCQAGRMADGTFVRPGSVASNAYRLGTRLFVRPAPGARRVWVVRDRIGWGSQLDFWVGSCWAARQWGRRLVSVRAF